MVTTRLMQLNRQHDKQQFNCKLFETQNLTWNIEYFQINWAPHSTLHRNIPVLTCFLFLVFALPLPPVVSVLQPAQSGTRSHLELAILPLPIFSIAFLKLTASSRPSAPPSGSPRCLRFSHWWHSVLIYLLTYSQHSHQYNSPFLARDSMLSTLYAIARPSVHPSVTRVDQSKTV